MAGEGPVLEAREAVGGLLREPDGPIRRGGHPGQLGHRRRERERRHRPVGRHSRDQAARAVRVPGGAVTIDGEAERLEVLASLREALDAVLPEDAEGVGEVEREPHGAVGPDGDGGGDVPLALHPVLGEAAPDPERVEPERDSDEGSDEDTDGDQVASANPREPHPRPSGEGLARARWSRS